MNSLDVFEFDTQTFTKTNIWDLHSTWFFLLYSEFEHVESDDLKKKIIVQELTKEIIIFVNFGKSMMLICWASKIAKERIYNLKICFAIDLNKLKSSFFTEIRFPRSRVVQFFYLSEKTRRVIHSICKEFCQTKSSWFVGN